MINIILLILGIILSILLNYKYQNKINTKDEIEVEKIIKYQIPINVILIFLLIISFYKQNMFTIVSIVICAELYIFYISIIYNLIDEDKILKVEKIKSENIFYLKKQLLIMNTLEKYILIVTISFIVSLFMNRYDYTIFLMVTVWLYIYIGKTYKIDGLHGKIRKFLTSPLSKEENDNSRLTEKEINARYDREVQLQLFLDKRKYQKVMAQAIFLPMIVLEILCHGGVVYGITFIFIRNITEVLIRKNLNIKLKYYSSIKMITFIFIMIIICLAGFIEFILFTIFQGTL